MITITLWVLIMIMAIVLQGMQILLGTQIPEFNEFNRVINTCAWITMGIKYSVVGISFALDYRRNR